MQQHCKLLKTTFGFNYLFFAFQLHEMWLWLLLARGEEQQNE